MDKQKYEREIEEILQKYEKEAPPKPRTQNVDRQVGGFRPAFAPPTRRRIAPPSGWRRVSALQYMIAAFVVAFLAIYARSIPLLATLLVLVSIALFFMPFFVYRSTGTTSGGWSTREEKRWRGQVIDFNTRREISDDPLAGVKRWFRRR